MCSEESLILFHFALLIETSFAHAYLTFLDIMIRFWKIKIKKIIKKLFKKLFLIILAIFHQKQINHTDYLVHFELFYRDIRNLKILSEEDPSFAKRKIKDIAMSSFRTYNNNVPQHLSNYQKETLILKKVYHKTTYISSFRNLTKVIYVYVLYEPEPNLI